MRRIPLSALIVAGSLILGGGIAAAQGSLPTSGSADGTSVPPSYLTDDAGRSLILRGFNTASSARAHPTACRSSPKPISSANMPTWEQISCVS
ncbi:hypothetical protein ACETU7_20570 [Rhodococcus sp. 3Y1]